MKEESVLNVCKRDVSSGWSRRVHKINVTRRFGVKGDECTRERGTNGVEIGTTNTLRDEEMALGRGYSLNEGLQEREGLQKAAVTGAPCP